MISANYHLSRFWRNFFCFLFVLFFVFSFKSFAQTSEAFSFAVYGDNRNGEETFRFLLNKINKDDEIAFSINTGDFITYGKEVEYKKYIELTKLSKVKIYNVMGNHDAVNGGYRRFEKYFGPNYYSFSYKNSQFIILDNSFKGVFDAKQYNFLISELNKSKGKNIFVFFHKPVFDPSEVFPDYIMSERKITRDLIEIFKRYKVRYVFSGHIHGYAKADRDGVIYIVTAGAGAPLYLPRYLGGFHHYIKITVNGSKIKDEVFKIE
ncbi:MAG: Metallophosphoesterase [Candidatus Saganbacteria bacterium]|uniref:Metallophosphoesterase n=1 Tax=Candidatus Saganbacteria bacterium TaxID=2575572 RepID=A0A833P079_UNCSA|nr:MAG: Metallophosphoesterase [Candidatus Saganbacteria bacterium]